MKNMDETHFLVNVDNKRTFAFRGEEVIKYFYVVFGGEGISICMKISRDVS
jgi:hypothetical protein